MRTILPHFISKHLCRKEYSEIASLDLNTKFFTEMNKSIIIKFEKRKE